MRYSVIMILDGYLVNIHHVSYNGMTNMIHSNENVGFSFCFLLIMKLNYVLDLYKQNQFYL